MGKANKHGKVALVGRLIVQLCGGLGNQMFQYAAARALCEKNQAELILDTWSGFARDFQYRREFELGGMPILGRKASWVERAPFWHARITRRITGRDYPQIYNCWYGIHLNETEKKYSDSVKKINSFSKCWMTGYWQSPKYFDDIQAIIQKELMPPDPIGPFQAMGERMRTTNSVALGVRLYEESINPNAHAAGGRMKTVDSINQVIHDIERKQKDCHFYLFCTHRSPFLDSLQFSNSVTYVTHDDGFVGSQQCLWLLTQCRHHIFTNSSFYWWGAWLSQSLHNQGKQIILAADNFINEDGLCANWEKF